LPTQPTLDEARDNLFAALKKFLSQRDGAAQPYLALHHRLDRDTSGVILFAKQPSVNAATAELFSAHKAQKTYQCLTHAPEPGRSDTWIKKNYLGKQKGPGKKTHVVPVRSGGDYAETSFKILERLPRALWIQAQPRTGRMHQIRVHLAEDAMPILGDLTYGAEGARSEAPRLMLHAVNLTFPHPITNVETSVTSPLPEDFNQCLRRLRKS
jgi:23S rRNA-/tRNA-specific pseudouridylate synthase